MLRQSQGLQPRTDLSIGIDTNLVRAHIGESTGFAKEKTDCVGAKSILVAEFRCDPRITVARNRIIEQWLAGFRERHRSARKIADAIVDVVSILRLVVSVESEPLHHEERRNR